MRVGILPGTGLMTTSGDGLGSSTPGPSLLLWGGHQGGNVEKKPDAVQDILIGKCDTCEGIAWTYVGLLLGSGDAEIHMDAQWCLNECDPLIISITVHT